MSENPPSNKQQFVQILAIIALGLFCFLVVSVIAEHLQKSTPKTPTLDAQTILAIFSGLVSTIGWLINWVLSRLKKLWEKIENNQRTVEALNNRVQQLENQTAKLHDELESIKSQKTWLQLRIDHQEARLEDLENE